MSKSCVTRKNFPKDWWNHGLNPITGFRKITPIYKPVEDKLETKWS